MTTTWRTAFLFACSLIGSTFACGGSTETADSESNLSASTVEVCEANPPPNARCAACPLGYRGPSGTYTCECCTGPEVDAGENADAGADAGGEEGEVCEGNPPPNVRCAEACPYGYKGPSGTFTCACCTGPAPDAGEICGPPPPTARCIACPNGVDSFKQIDGKPTCECCSS